jgi:hypothetical protein
MRLGFRNDNREGELSVSELNSRAFLPIEPRIQVRCAETPHFPHMGAMNLPASRQLLKGLVMNIQELRSLMTVEEGFKIRNAE